MCANEAGDISLLGWGAAAGDDGRELHSEGYELGLITVEEECEGLAVNKETTVSFVAEEFERVIGEIFTFYCVCASWVSTRPFPGFVLQRPTPGH